MSFATKAVAFRVRASRRLVSRPAQDRWVSASALRCVWIETGDPVRPLACMWYREDLIASTLSDADSNNGIYSMKETHEHLSHLATFDSGRRAVR
jgi:hypothetical protein